MSTGTIRLLVVDDSPDITDALALTIRGEAGMTLVGTLESADDLIGAIGRLTPSVVLIDLSMGGRPPLEAVREAHARFPEVRAIIYSGYDDPETIDEAVEAGAWGFASKHDDIEKVLRIVRRVAQGEMWIGRSGVP